MEMENFLAEFEGLKDERPQIAEKIKSHNLPVIIFGAAQMAAEVTKELQKFGVEVSGYAVDGKYFQPNKTFLGLPIYNFDELSKTPDKYVFFLGMGTKTKAGEFRLAEFMNDKTITKFCWLWPVEQITLYYISSHKQQFWKTYNLLADDVSRNIMTAYLKAQVTEDFSYLKNLSDPNRYFNELTRPAIQGGGA